MSDDKDSVNIPEESSSFVDFSEIENDVANANKDKKEQVAKEIESESNVVVETDTNDAANDLLEKSLATEEEVEKYPEPVKVETKTEEKPKSTKKHSEPKQEVKKETLVLEEDDNIKKANTPIADDTIDIDDAEEEELANSIDPKSRSHRVVIDDKDNKDDFVVDSDNTQEIVEEETLSKEDLAEKEAKRKKIEELYEKKTGFKVFGGEDGIPCVYASDNPNIKALREFDIPADKIKPIANDDEKLMQNFLDQYITMSNAKDSPVVDHRISRFPCLLSGYYAEMTDYSMGELTSVMRVMRSPEYKFAYKFQQELVSLYNHISWTSLKPNGEKLTFEEWLKATKFKDLDMFYFGAYDATYPGVGNYDITCGNCHNTFRVSKSNKALAYLLQNGNDPILKDTFIRDVLMEKIPVEELKKTLIYSKANSVYDEKVIRPHNIKVGYACPSLMDILEYLIVFESLLGDDIPDLEALIDDTMDGHNILTLFTLIRRITVPVNRGKNSEGKNVISFITIDTDVDDDEKRMNNRRYIVKILKDLPESEFAELFSGKEIAERKRLVGITPILHNITCTNCNSNISRIPIDMRGNFFMKTATVVDQIDQF